MKTITTTTTVTTLFNSEAPGSPWIHSMDIDGDDVVNVHVEATGDSLEVEITLTDGRHLTIGGWKSYDDFGSEVIERRQVVTETPVVPATPVVLNIESDDDLARVMNAEGFVGCDWQGYDAWTGDGYGIALGFSKPVEGSAVTSLLAYFCRSSLAMGSDGFDGNIVGTPVGLVNEHGEATVWYWSCDLTKSARDDVAHELHHLREFVRTGSPVRKTDRKGPKGTRAVIGVGEDVQVFVALDN